MSQAFGKREQQDIGEPTHTGRAYWVQGAPWCAVQSVLYVGHATCILAPAFSYPETICKLEYKLTCTQWEWDQALISTS